MSSRVEGSTAILELSRRAGHGPGARQDLKETAVYQASDPETVILELVTLGIHPITDRTFTGTSIQVFGIRDGKTLLFRDYTDPRGLADTLVSDHRILARGPPPKQLAAHTSRPGPLTAARRSLDHVHRQADGVDARSATAEVAAGARKSLPKLLRPCASAPRPARLPLRTNVQSTHQRTARIRPR